MRFFLGSILLAVFCAYVAAQADYYDPEDQGILVAEDGYGSDILLEAPVHYRQKRATCDLLSGTGIQHSACAAQCVARGYKGGWCDSRAVCNCRR